MRLFLIRSLAALAALTVIALSPQPAPAQTPPVAGAPPPPRTWIDPDTGHRIIRLSDEPNSGAPYFNINAYTPGGKEMMYTAPDGIHVLDLATRKTRLVVAKPPLAEDPLAPNGTRQGVRAIVVGHKTPTVFYTQYDPAAKATGLYSCNMDTGAKKKLADLPPRAGIDTVNADETLAAGTYIVGSGTDYNNNRPAPGSAASTGPVVEHGPNYQPPNKAQMMEQRLAARLPIVLFTLDLHTGKMKTLLRSTDWINHLLFSPSDPSLLMYCHEGPWQKVDRIWMIHTDATHNTLIHKRTMALEIAGHEFWGLDGKTIWYDWQYPKGQVFYLAGYNLATGKRTAFHMERNEWSIHFNLTPDLSLFCGDGGDVGQVARATDGKWIELFRPQMLPLPGALNGPNFWQPGVFHSEHLVNMSKHDYKQEPNVRFSPDKSMVIFTGNMFGPSYVFGVEVAKAAPSAGG